MHFVSVKASLSVVLAVSLAMAGCAGGGKQDTAATSSMAAPPTADAESGSITGFVLDDQVLPVVGATVAIPSLNLETTTDETGRFTLNKVEPGTHALHVNRLGYTAKAQQVTVIVGEVLELRITLVPIAIEEPRYESIPFTGQFQCSVAAVDVLWVDCGEYVFPESTSSFAFTKPEGVRHIVGELKWTSASAGTGRNLDFNLVQDEGPTSQWYANTFGASPLKIHVTIGEKFENPDSPAAVGSSSYDQIVDDEDKKLAFDIYSSPTYVEDTALAGVTWQQKFEGQVTLFYGMDVPADFSAFPDA